MKIKKLLQLVNINKAIINNHKITNIEDNSKLCCKNSLFFSLPSYTHNESNIIKEAIANGAKTIIYEKELKHKLDNINYIEVNDVKKALALIVKIYYKDITTKIKLIGITGTNGKTTTSNLLYDFFSYEGIESMLVGTNGIYFQNEHYNTNNTTPSLLFTTKLMKQAIKKGLKYVVMEVSSIGIRELRVMYYDFDIIILSNVTHDHLDYHKTIIDYKFSKGLLLHSIPYKKDKYIILNKDIDTYSFYNKMCNAKVITYSINSKSDYHATNIVKNLNETKFRLLDDNKQYYFKTSLIGAFNVYNILSSIACITKLNFSIEDFSKFLKLYVNVSGRMDIVKYNDRSVVIDFAHTPDSVSNTLKTLKEYSNRKLTVIIGCGGNRDKVKRSIIGEITSLYADKIIFTNDNPRDEVEIDIINDMICDIKHKNYDIILDRKKAIYSALDNSIKDEIIAILGKGSEEYQIIQGVKHPFNDKKTVKSYIKEHSNE